MATIEYKCPNCGAALAFDPDVGKVKCDHCGSVYTFDQLSSFYKDKENKTKSDFLSGYKYTALEKFSIIPEEEISFAKLEAVSDEITGDFIAELRCVPFGAETVVSYLLSKEAEIKNTRIVMSGKLAGLAPDKIRERLRFSYV